MIAELFREPLGRTEVGRIESHGIADLQYALAIWSEADEAYVHYERARQFAEEIGLGG